MAMARSKITAQGQISVPLEVRRKLGIGPGTILEWSEAGDGVLIRRAATVSSDDIHRALFSDKPDSAASTEEMDEGIRRYLRDKHARR